MLPSRFILQLGRLGILGQLECWRDVRRAYGGLDHYSCIAVWSIELSQHLHACTSTHSIAQEIQQFRCLSVSPDDVMTWWESQQNTYPNISKLARALLAIPATSVPSERIFSLAGLAINAKRSGLLPSSVDKMIFVHENVHLTL